MNTHVALSVQAFDRSLHVYACTAGQLRDGRRAWFELLPTFRKAEEVTLRGVYRWGTVDMAINWLIFGCGFSYHPKKPEAA